MNTLFERRLRLVHFGCFAGMVLANGANATGAAAIGLAAATLLLLAGSTMRYRRSELHRLATVLLLVPLLVLAHTAFLVWWDPTGAAAHPVWEHLRQQFGTTGGNRSVMRFEAAWETAEAVLPFFLAAAAVPLYRDALHVRQLHRRLTWLGAAFALYGIVQVVLFPTWYFGRNAPYAGSLTGFYVNHNAAAAFLGMTLLAGLAELERAAERIDLRRLPSLILDHRRIGTAERRVLVTAAVVAVQFIALFLTRSRAGSVVGLLAVGAFLALRLPPLLKHNAIRSSSRVKIAAGIAVPMVLLILADRVLYRFDTVGLDDARWCVYPAFWRMALDAWPSGLGLGSVVAAFPSYRRPECGISGYWETAHDSWLEGLLTLGALFPLLVVAVLAVTLPPIWRAWRDGRRSKPIALVALLAAAAMMLHSIVDFPLEIPANAALLALLAVAAVGAAPRPGQRREPLADRPAEAGRRRTVRA